MTESDPAASGKSSAHQAIAEQARRVQSLQLSAYSTSDPSANPDLLDELATAERKLRELQELDANGADAKTDTPGKAKEREGRFLGANTTGLVVTVTRRMDPLPTGSTLR